MYEKRIQRVLDAMADMGLEQMFNSDPDSIWYLTGFYVAPFERLYGLYLHRNGNHKFFLNKLFPTPESNFETVWFTDTDDYLAILAANVDANAPLGVDKDWPARFLLPLMAHNPNSRCVVASQNRVVTVELIKNPNRNAYLSVDGGKAQRLNIGDVATIRRSNLVTKLIRLKDRSFYDVVNMKFKNG